MRRAYRNLILLLIAALALSALALSAQESVSFKLVVHPDNPTTSAKRKEVANFFLRKVKAWPDGTGVEPVDLRSTSEVREVFSREIHNRSVRSILLYWQRQVFSGRTTSPPTFESDAEVLRFVRERRGAIGYVSDTASIEGVRVLTISDQEAP